MFVLPALTLPGRGMGLAPYAYPGAQCRARPPAPAVPTLVPEVASKLLVPRGSWRGQRGLWGSGVGWAGEGGTLGNISHPQPLSASEARAGGWLHAELGGEGPTSSELQSTSCWCVRPSVGFRANSSGIISAGVAVVAPHLSTLTLTGSARQLGPAPPWSRAVRPATELLFSLFADSGRCVSAGSARAAGPLALSGQGHRESRERGARLQTWRALGRRAALLHSPSLRSGAGRRLHASPRPSTPLRPGLC